MSDVHSPHLLLNSIQFTLIHGPNSLGCCAVLLLRASDSTFTTRLIHNLSFPLQPSLFILPELFLCSSEVAYWTPMDLGGLSYLFAFSHCSWNSQGKNTEVVCLSFPSPLSDGKVKNMYIRALKFTPEVLDAFVFVLYFLPQSFFLVISCDLPNYMTLSSALMFMKLLKAFFIITFSDFFFCFFFSPAFLFNSFSFHLSASISHLTLHVDYLSY